MVQIRFHVSSAKGPISVRFLHTADWHLGRTMRGRSRSSEFEAVLAEIVDIARTEKIDAMLVCGDIWDTASPSPESDRLLHETLREFIGLGVQVILLSGNHDNPHKLQALGRLSDLLGVFVQPYVRHPDRGGLIKLTKGNEVARVAAIPWIQEGRVIDAAEVLAVEHERYQSYAERAGAVYRAMGDALAADDVGSETINIVAGHLFVDGARLAAIDGSERLLHIGEAYGVAPASLPSNPHYIALGHIHQPQEIMSTIAPAAYAGSLLQLDFGERGQQKVVRIIDARVGRPIEQEVVALTTGRQLVELTGNLDDIVAQAHEVSDDYVRVVLQVDGPEPGLASRVRDVIPSAVDVRLEYEHEPETEPAPEMAKLSPQELFVRYYRSRHESDPTPELLELLVELLDEATAESDVA